MLNWILPITAFVLAAWKRAPARTKEKAIEVIIEMMKHFFREYYRAKT